MSGVLKSVGKVFSKVVKSKVFKIALGAAAVYFTAGLGMAAMGGAAAEFAAGMPLIGEAAGALGIGGAAAGGEVAATAAGGSGVIGGASKVASAVSAGSGFLKSAPDLPEQLSGPDMPDVSQSGSGGKPWQLPGLNENGQKVLFDALGGGAKAMLGAYAAGKNADAYTQEKQDERDWRDKNRQTTDMSNVYVGNTTRNRPAYQTPGIINAVKNGG